MNNHAQSDSGPCLLWSISVDDEGNVTPVADQPLLPNTQPRGYLWAHLQSDTDDAYQCMKDLGISDAIAESLYTLETRPRASIVDGGTLIYLRGINRNPDADIEDMVSLRIWFNGNTVISARRKNRRLLSVQDTKDMLEGGDGPTNTEDLVLELIARVANRISEIVDDLDDRLSAFEVEGGMNNSDRFALSIIRRQAAAIRRYLAPQREALDNLYRLHKTFSQEQMYTLRDLTERMARYVEDLDLAKERAMVLQDELRNRVAEQQGLRMYVLSLVTAIFLPLSFLTGVFGMNVAGLPGTEEPKAFFYLAIAMVVLSGIMLVGMLWRKWL